MCLPLVLLLGTCSDLLLSMLHLQTLCHRQRCWENWDYAPSRPNKIGPIEGSLVLEGDKVMVTVLCFREGSLTSLRGMEMREGMAYLIMGH